MTHNPHPDEPLADHGRFVRSLALGLLGDSHTAEDIAQDAVVAALQNPLRDSGALRAWLLKTGQRLAFRARRGDQRRYARERLVARAESTPSSDGAREHVLAEVTEAVLSLREPYRATVMQHYYEGKTPDEIARETSVAISTVHSQLRRARELIRIRLDRRTPGGRVAWSAALVSLTVPLSAPPLGGLTPALKGALVMSSQTKTAAIAAILVLTVLLMITISDLAPWSVADDSVTPTIDDVDGTRSTSVVAVGSPNRADPARHTVTGTADVVVDPVVPDPTRGSLLLRVAWEDGSPASGRVFETYAVDDPNPHRTARTITTDAHGERHIDNLTPGKVICYGAIGGSGAADVRAGEVTTLEITLPNGIELEVFVCDANSRPVPQADVWVSDYGNDERGRMAGRTDVAGQLVLQGVGPGRVASAFAEDFGPSPLVEIHGKPGASTKITLRLNPTGARLTGVIVDENGIAVDGADLLVEPSRSINSLSGSTRNLAPRLGRVDRNGAFTFAGLASGKLSLLVRPSLSFSPQVVEVDLEPGEVRGVQIEVLRAARVRGVVRDQGGLPVRDAKLQYGPYGSFLSTFTKTDRKGAFLLDALPLGRTLVRVEKQGAGKAQRELILTSGTDVKWDPVLDLGRVYRGRLTDEGGVGHGDWSIYAIGRDSVDSRGRIWSQSLRTDHTGRFSITGCPAGSLELEIRGKQYTPVALHRHRVKEVTGTEETIVISAKMLPSAAIHGTVLLNGVAAAGKVTARRRGRSYSSTAEVDPATGSYALRDLIPGSYWLTFRSDVAGVQALGRCEVRVGEDHDAGERALARPGYIRVETDGRPGIGSPIEAVRVVPVYDGDHPQIKGAKLIPRSFRSGLASAVALVPGHYRLIAGGETMVEEVRTVDIVAGETLVVSLTSHRGTACTFTLQPEGEVPKRFAIRIRNEGTGVEISALFTLRPETGAWTTAMRLAKGSYRLRAHASVGLASSPDDPVWAERRFVIDREHVAREFEVHLRVPR